MSYFLPPRRRLLVRGLVFLVLASAALGCVSTKERYERARTHQAEARYGEAASEYVKVLRDDPNFRDARRRLYDAASAAIGTWMEDARAKTRSGRPEAAVRRLDQVFDLHEACQSVDVDLRLPDGYTALRDTARRQAADAALAEADRAAASGRFDEAVDALERARRYVDSSERLARIDTRQAEVLLGWADADMQQGRHVAAYERAGGVFDYVGSDHSLAGEAEALRQAAVRQGTRRVAFLPFWHTETAAESLPEYFTQDLNDILFDRHWSEPPPFIASADRVALRRILRSRGLRRVSLSQNDAAAVGRAAEADFVVAGDLTAFSRTEENVEEEDVAVGYRSPDGDGALVDTVYTRRTYDLRLEATVEYRVVDVRTGRVVDARTARAGVEGEVTEGVFPGDWRALDLSGAQKDLFDPDVRRRRQGRLENELIDQLAGDLASAAFDRVLSRID
jgi:tetratricopeptide (TPR) repeat protein